MKSVSVLEFRKAAKEFEKSPSLNPSAVDISKEAIKEEVEKVQKNQA